MKKNAMLLAVFMFAISFCLVAEEQPWLTNLDQAIVKAKEAKLDILVDFTGSDWCVWCQRLDTEVFQTEEWKKEVGKKYILVSLDFPEQKEMSKEQKEYNNKIAIQYGIEGFPTICLLDSEGNIYAKTGYQRGGPVEYFKHLDELSKNKEKRNTLLAAIQAQEGQGEAYLKAIGEFLTFADSAKIVSLYTDLKEKAIAADAENKSGYLLKFSEEFYQLYIKQAAETEDTAKKEELLKKAEVYFANIKKFDAEKANNLEISNKDIPRILENFLKKEEWKEAIKELSLLLEKKPTGEVAQIIHYFTGLSQYRLNDKPAAVKSLESAIQIDPQGQIGQKLSEVLESLKAEIQEEAKPTEQAKPAEETKKE